MPGLRYRPPFCIIHCEAEHGLDRERNRPQNAQRYGDGCEEPRTLHRRKDATVSFSLPLPERVLHTESVRGQNPPRQADGVPESLACVEAPRIGEAGQEKD